MKYAEELRARAAHIRAQANTLLDHLDDAANVVERASYPQPAEMSDEEIIAIANVVATRYTNREAPQLTSYGFMQSGVLRFARMVLEQAAKKGTV